MMRKSYHPGFKVVLLLCMLLFLPSFGILAEEADHAPIELRETAYISPEIAASIIDEPGKPMEALILLKEQADTSGMARITRNLLEKTLRIPASHQQMKSICRKAVVKSLQDVADSTQGPLLSQLNLEKLLGRVKNLKSFYIVNMLYIEAHPTVIMALSRNPAVKSILPNTPFELQESGTAGKIIPAEEIAPSAATVEWNIKKIKADQVWEQFGVTGEGVVVGIIDSGAYWQHPALKEKYRGYDPDKPNTPDNEYNWHDVVYETSAPNDCLGSSHGTHVTGIIIASTATNIYGVAPGARWIAANAFKTDGSSTPQHCIDAAQYMLAPVSNGGIPNPDMAPDILNCSWGMPPDGEQNVDEWFRPMVNSLRSAGILPVFAAGNAKSPPAAVSSIHSPAMYPESLSVAAVNNQNMRASFSNRGPAIHYPGVIKPDISAPGVGICSTIKSGNYGSKDGTSMATPHIVGTAALMLSYRPTLDVNDLEDMIRETAVPLTGGADTDSPNYGYGYGLVDAYAAIEAWGWIKDPGLEAAIREELNIPVSEEITLDDLETLENLVANGRNIKTLDGLQHAVRLTQLDLSNNEITDIAPLVANSNNGGLGDGDEVDLRNNYLDLRDGSKASEDIAALEANGVNVLYDPQKQSILGKMPPPEWAGRKIKWVKNTYADHYKLKLFRDNAEVFSKTFNASLTEYDMAGTIDTSGPGCYTATIQAMGDGNPWVTGEPSNHSAILKIIAVPDTNLENLIKNIIGIEKGGISDTDMAGLTQINYIDTNKKIGNLTGIEYAVNLDYIKLIDQNISNIGPLANLTNLYYLNLDNNDISDISPLISNIDAGGFQTGDNEPEISLVNNCLSLDSNGQTMRFINQLLECGIKVTYIPQRKIPVNSVTLNHGTLDLKVGDTPAILIATIHPHNATNKKVTWATENSAVARVDQLGEVEAISSGTTKITVKTEDGAHVASCTVNVSRLANNGDPLEIDFHDPPDNEKNVAVNKTMSIVFNKDIMPGTNYDRIILKDTAQNDQEIGLTKEIEGRKIFLTPVEKLEYDTIYKLSFPGEAVKDAAGNKNAAFKISFRTPPEPIPVQSVSLNATHLKLFCGGATATLVPIVEPDNASEWECRWESSEPETATVTGDRARNGIITPLASGSAFITAIISDRGHEHRATCIVDAIKFGDVNGNGKIEVGDAIILLRHIVGLNTLTGPYELAGKVNGEQNISVSDAISILRHIVQLISQFPAEAEIFNQ